MKKAILKLTMITTVILMATSITSCKKYGCTDPDATNYDEKAKENNEYSNSCSYESNKLSFWFDKSFSDSLINMGYTELNVELAGEKRFTDITAYKTSAPTCGDINPGIINFSTYLGNNPNDFVYLKIYANGPSFGGEFIIYLNSIYGLTPGCHSYKIEF